MRAGRAFAGTILALAVGAALAGCGPVQPTPQPSSGATPGSTPAGPPEDAGPSGSTQPVGAASPAASPGEEVTRDDSLLAILPPFVDGTPVTAEEASFGEVAGDAAFAANVDRAAFAIAVGQDDLASGVVAQLTPGVFGDAFFRDWRETYNEGACEQAGGVVGNAEAELGGRTVYIATCEGGLRVYHAYVAERGVLVSLFSLGEGRFGERLMADLRP